MPAKIWCSIDIEYTCQERPRLLALDILRRISDRSENEILELKLGGVLNVYTVEASACITTEIEDLAQDIFSATEKCEKETLARTEQILRPITGKHASQDFEHTTSVTSYFIANSAIAPGS